MKPIYVSSIQTFSGKTAVCLALGRRLQADGHTVGYLKPVSTQPGYVEKRLADEDAAFVKEVLGLEEEVWDLAPVVGVGCGVFRASETGVLVGGDVGVAAGSSVAVLVGTMVGVADGKDVGVSVAIVVGVELAVGVGVAIGDVSSTTAGVTEVEVGGSCSITGVTGTGVL